MKLDFDPEKHEYRLDGELIPSVSELLKPLTEAGYANINPAVLAEAARRGTEVHEATESIDYGLDPEDISPDIFPYLDAYCAFLRDYRPEWYGIEDMVCGSYTSSWGGVEYAGTIDRWGMIDGKMSVLDIKTVQAPSTRQKVTTAVQTYAYARALHQMGKAEQYSNLYALYLKKDGTYNLVDLREFCKEKRIWADILLDSLMQIYHEKTYIESLFKGKEREKKDE